MPPGFCEHAPSPLTSLLWVLVNYPLTALTSQTSLLPALIHTLSQAPYSRWHACSLLPALHSFVPTLTCIHTSAHMLILRPYTHRLYTHPGPCPLSQAPHPPINAHTHYHTSSLKAPHSPMPMLTFINSVLTCAHTLSHLLRYLFYHMPPYTASLRPSVTLPQPFPSG